MDGSFHSNLRLPDFIIGGAPKCGTTSVHFVLGQSPDVGIPDDEVHFFDADDPIAHPDFVRHGGGCYDVDAPPSQDWYAARFAPYRNKLLIGEDSTLYLQSEVAPARIARTLPNVKLIFMLRDPVRRAYSQYWHMVTRGRATCDFETAIRRHPPIMLGSTYLPGLRRYRDHFDAGQVRVCLFEDYLADPRAFVADLCTFLGLAPIRLEPGAGWHNRTTYPAHPRMQRLLNRVSRQVARLQYVDHFNEASGLRRRLGRRAHGLYFRHVHPRLLTRSRPPEMAPETQAFLTRHLSDRNAGLSRMLGRDLSAVWPGFRS